MSKKIFKTDLSVRGIEKIKRELLDYKNDLEIKCNKIVKRLMELGISVANAKINESPMGKYVSVQVHISNGSTDCKGLLLATGKIQEHEGYEPFNVLLAVEFGAGIYYNKTPNPNADKFELGVGTFPGQIHAFEDGWYYYGEDEKWHYTHGTKATMPMYNADMEIIRNMVKVVKNVFRE